MVVSHVMKTAKKKKRETFQVVLWHSSSYNFTFVIEGDASFAFSAVLSLTLPHAIPPTDNKTATFQKLCEELKC